MLTPEIRTVLHQAWQYMQDRVNHGAQAPLDTEAWRAAETAVDTAALQGDTAATKAACRQWWGLLTGKD